MGVRGLVDSAMRPWISRFIVRRDLGFRGRSTLQSSRGWRQRRRREGVGGATSAAAYRSTGQPRSRRRSRTLLSDSYESSLSAQPKAGSQQPAHDGHGPGIPRGLLRECQVRQLMVHPPPPKPEGVRHSDKCSGATLTVMSGHRAVRRPASHRVDRRARRSTQLPGHSGF